MSIGETQYNRYQDSKRQATAYIIVHDLLFKPRYSIVLDEDMAVRVEGIIKCLPPEIGSHLSAGFLQGQDIHQLRRVLRN